MQSYNPMTSFGHDESMRCDVEDTRGDEEQAVAFLARLAGQREALEFAVGTGRIALPLTAAGVPVDGIEMSRHMILRMRGAGRQGSAGSSGRRSRAGAASVWLREAKNRCGVAGQRGVAGCRPDGTLTQVDRRPQPSNTLIASSTVRSTATAAIALGQRVRMQDQASQALDDLLQFLLGDRHSRRPGGV